MEFQITLYNPNLKQKRSLSKLPSLPTINARDVARQRAPPGTLLHFQ